MNEPLVRSITNRYSPENQNGSFRRWIVQEGRLGFLHGVRKYEELKGASLASYGALWVRSYVSRSLKQEATNDARKVLPVDGEDEEIFWARASWGVVPASDDIASCAEALSRVICLFRGLTPRNRYILCANSGLFSCEWKSLREIADEEGVTREAIRQRRNRLLRRLRIPDIDYLRHLASAENVLAGNGYVLREDIFA